MNEEFNVVSHDVDFCVVGGGMAGICAALSAARHGAKVVLMHDRPVLGGNSSSECRVHICGADRHNNIPNMRETGILEELRLDNIHTNPNRKFPLWDNVLYEKVTQEPDLNLLLNCSCIDAVMDGNAIVSVKGWQLTTQTYHRVNAKIFADCSGDAILAPLTDAKYRMGREGREEYNESIAPEQADEKTMGMTCLFQAKEYDSPQPFEARPNAYTYLSCDDLPYGQDGHQWIEMGYWWVELGGEAHSIYDTEQLRDELLKIIFGVWDHIKNHCPEKDKAANWALDWIQFLPGKRESRRYIGEHVLNQNDIESEGKFPDLVAYGGWSMDDHHPSGFNSAKLGVPATMFHTAPSPYGIPYRCLYSVNICNLMFAGRNASCTHAAMSSTRVMGTGCSMGYAVGTAAAMAIEKGLRPAGFKEYMDMLQQTLLADDCYLPWVPQKYCSLIKNADLTASCGDPEPVRDGINRPVGEDSHCWRCTINDTISYQFIDRAVIDEITVILDSDLTEDLAMSYHQRCKNTFRVPECLPKKFRIEGLLEGEWSVLAEYTDNYQRLIKLKVGRQLHGIRFILDETWGDSETNIYAFYCTTCK